MISAPKRLEIRDRGTLLVAVAWQVSSLGPDPFLERVGFGPYPYILLCFPGPECSVNYDPYEWPRGARTRCVAHEWLIAHWDGVEDGGLIDVEYILGERSEPKQHEIV